ncbi:MAG: hypothetical protein KAS46_05030 [Candidatus Aureabacteria bacterium]|nr:hypothetical protein [Candidatus Auribacterota bacterium]
MKKFIFMATIFVLSFLNIARAEILEKDTTVQGITFSKGIKVSFYKSGKLEEAILAQDQEIQGIPCAKGHRVYFYESGKLKRATLVQDLEIQGINFIKGAKIWLDEFGELNSVTLSQDLEIQGIKFPKGCSINLDGYGKLRLVHLGSSLEIQNIPCAKGDVSFYESGKLKSAKLSQDQEIQGIPCAASNVFFYESEKVKIARLAQDQEIQGIKFVKGKHVRLYESGKLKETKLAQDQEVQGIKFIKGTSMRFYESGKIKYARLGQDREIQGIPCARGDISFYESGKLETAELSQDQEIQGIKFVKGSRISFDKLGKLGQTILLAQKYLKKYDNVAIDYRSPKFLENDKILFLTMVKCHSDWDSNRLLSKIEITEMNIENLKEKILFKLEQENNENFWEMFDFHGFNFDVDTKGNYCILEPNLNFKRPETLKLIIIKLKSKEQTTITRRGIKYRISPNGKLLIYGGMGSCAYDFLKKKTIYLTDIMGKAREIIYETQDIIRNWCWVDNDNILIHSQAKESNFCIKFINIHTKEITNVIKNKDSIDSVIARYVAPCSFDGKFTIKGHWEGDLILTNLKSLEDRVLKRGHNGVLMINEN